MQNLLHVVKTTWGAARGLVLYTLGGAALTLLVSLLELTIAPVILGQVERSVPLPALLGTIGFFTLALLILSSLRTYLKSTESIWKQHLLQHLLLSIYEKECTTSYPNMLSSGFLAVIKESYYYIQDDDGTYMEMLKEFGKLLTAVAGFLLYLLVLSGLKPLLMAVVIGTTAVSFLVSRRVQNWDEAHRQERRKYRTRMLFVTNTVLANKLPKDIRIFGMQSWLSELHDKTLALYQGFCNRREAHYLLGKLADLALSIARNGIAYWYLITLTLEKGLPASQFLLYFGAVSGFTAWITDILNGVIELRQQSRKVTEARELLDWPEPFRFAGGRSIPQGESYELRLEDVSYRYPEAEKDTISHMDLTIRPGEKLAIVGLNGAGKTTLVKLLCGLLDPTDGRVLLNGVDIKDFNRREYYSLFTAVFQKFAWQETDIASNVAQALTNIDRERVADCVKKAGMEELMGKLPKGIDTHLGKFFHDDGVELSGGEMQRLMLARALYKDAPMLILDEPTAALDPIAESETYEQFSQIAKEKTTLYISHRLASTRFCDKIALISDGKVVEEGSHQELMDREQMYYDMFMVQSQYYQNQEDESDEENQ